MAGDDSLGADCSTFSSFLPSFLSFSCFPTCFNAMGIVEALLRKDVIPVPLKCDFLGEQKTELKKNYVKYVWQKSPVNIALVVSSVSN